FGEFGSDETGRNPRGAAPQRLTGALERIERGCPVAIAQSEIAESEQRGQMSSLALECARKMALGLVAAPELEPRLGRARLTDGECVGALAGRFGKPRREFSQRGPIPSATCAREQAPERQPRPRIAGERESIVLFGPRQGRILLEQPRPLEMNRAGER